MRTPNFILISAALALQMVSAGAQQVPDFALRDLNLNSVRANQVVSPRDYLLQVSGYYFGIAAS